MQTGGLNQEMPVVVLTANADGENLRLYQQKGFDGYLTKPVTCGQLDAELLKHLPREIVTLTDMKDSFGVVQAPFARRSKQKELLLISTDSVANLPREMTFAAMLKNTFSVYIMQQSTVHLPLELLLIQKVLPLKRVSFMQIADYIMENKMVRTGLYPHMINS